MEPIWFESSRCSSWCFQQVVKEGWLCHDGLKRKARAVAKEPLASRHALVVSTPRRMVRVNSAKRPEQERYLHTSGSRHLDFLPSILATISAALVCAGIVAVHRRSRALARRGTSAPFGATSVGRYGRHGMCRSLERACEDDIQFAAYPGDEMSMASGETTTLRPHKQTDEAMSISSGEAEGEVHGKLLEVT